MRGVVHKTGCDGTHTELRCAAGHAYTQLVLVGGVAVVVGSGGCVAFALLAAMAAATTPMVFLAAALLKGSVRVWYVCLHWAAGMCWLPS